MIAGWKCIQTDTWIKNKIWICLHLFMPSFVLCVHLSKEKRFDINEYNRPKTNHLDFSDITWNFLPLCSAFNALNVHQYYKTSNKCPFNGTHLFVSIETNFYFFQPKRSRFKKMENAFFEYIETTRLHSLKEWKNSPTFTIFGPKIINLSLIK